MEVKLHLTLDQKNKVRLKMTRDVKYHLYRAFRLSGMSAQKACQLLGYATRYMPFTFLDRLPQNLCEDWLDSEITDAVLLERYRIWRRKDLANTTLTKGSRKTNTNPTPS